MGRTVAGRRGLGEPRLHPASTHLSEGLTLEPTRLAVLLFRLSGKQPDVLGDGAAPACGSGEPRPGSARPPASGRGPREDRTRPSARRCSPGRRKTALYLKPGKACSPNLCSPFISQVTMVPSLNFPVSKTETTEPCLWRRLGAKGGHRSEQPAPDLAQSCAPYVRTSRSCPRPRGAGQALRGCSTLLNCYVNILWRRLKGLVFVFLNF